ncbi:MAG: fluoride efflux transporter CrcB [Solirubrobacteraceae bacterium]
MTAPELVAIGLLGGVGSVARFLLDGAVYRRAGRSFPYGTMVVNLTGSFLLGLLVGVAAGGGAERLLGTGLLGGYTTFSTWALESHRLGEAGRVRLAGLNLAASLLLGLGAAWVGRRLGGAL